MKPKAPTKDVEITITLTETAEGKLGIRTSIPDHAEGTVALLVADIAMAAMRDAMRETTGQNPPLEKGTVQ